MSLTKGAIARIMQGERVLNPVLQILNIQKLNTDNSDEDRFCLTISDGEYYHNCTLLASELNKMQHRGRLNENSIVWLNKYSIDMAGRRVSGGLEIIVDELTHCCIRDMK
ncbi:hypothetical protein AWZ03_004563 [Drosophila navojoa]|uniref:Replication factor-A protein 1 N-terminal domain-containing protein n=1 Tax=Drosophila navojoa TaxID=7232 RepID=A0A484BK05_DRONA|nr:hypothetical protein AWZ03_004563 [Drosophila navojoa]